MRPKEGTKIELQKEICQILSDSSDLQVCLVPDLSQLSDVNFRDVKKRETDHGRTERRTDRPS